MSKNQIGLFLPHSEFCIGGEDVWDFLGVVFSTKSVLPSSEFRFMKLALLITNLFYN